jgi:hypothetical protein
MCVIITASTSMRVVITVGSTRFDALVEAALSRPVLNALTQKGYSDVVIQCGNSQVDDASSPTERRERNVRRYGANIDVWKFKPSLDEEYDAADLVIGHAGLPSLYYHWSQYARRPEDLLSRLRNHTRCTAKGQTSHHCTQPNPPRQSSGRHGSCHGEIGTCEGIYGQVSVGCNVVIWAAFMHIEILLAPANLHNPSWI